MAGFQINRALSKPLTAFLLKTPLTPNQVTLLSLSFGIGAGVLLASGDSALFIPAAFAFVTAMVLDNCDGEIARTKNMRSVFGGWLDVVADVFTDLFFFAGLTIGLLKQGVGGPVLAAGFLCIAGGILNFTIVVVEKIKGFGPAVYNQHHPAGARRDSLISKIIEALREGDSSWLVVILIVLGQTEFLLYGAAVYMQALWISALVMNFKWIFGHASR